MGCKPTVEEYETDDEASLRTGKTIHSTVDEREKLKELMKVEAAGTISSVVSPEQKNVWKCARAKKLFTKLDKDGDGILDDD